MSTIVIVRHAQAVASARDRERALSDVGVRQAAALAAHYAPLAPALLLCSPAVRCQSTLAPLALLLHCQLEVDVRLRMGADPKLVIALVDQFAAATSAILCSHADVIPEVIAALALRSGNNEVPHNGPPASSWVYTVDRDGARLRHHPPEST